MPQKRPLPSIDCPSKDLGTLSLIPGNGQMPQKTDAFVLERCSRQLGSH